MALDRPHVIVIVSDTFRPDHIAANGHPYVRTPELDAWLDRCITFENAMVSSFPTIPTRTDWFTGRFSHPRHGWQALSPEAITLHDVLGEHDYVTQLLTDTAHMLRHNFWRGFRSFHILRGHEGDQPMTRLNDPIGSVVSDRRKTRVETGNVGIWPTLTDLHAHVNFRLRYEEESHSAKLGRVVTQWVEDNYRSERPFMLWADFFDVHEPWFPPRYLLDLYHPGYDGEPMPHPNYDSADAYDDDELMNLQARYAAQCTLLSKSVGTVFRLLDDTGLLENTIVVFMSDHGIYLGERGRTGKSLINPESFDAFPFHRELANICWSMYIPPSLGIKTLPAGTRLKQVVQPPDLMPTLLELCGIEPDDEMDMEGASLVPLLTGQSETPPRDVSVTTWHMNLEMPCRMPTVTDGQWTLLLHEPPDAEPPKLYHVERDPKQEHDVFGEHTDEAIRLHALMLDWLKAHGSSDDALSQLSAQEVGLA